jgi:hypothetical protein
MGAVVAPAVPAAVPAARSGDTRSGGTWSGSTDLVTLAALRRALDARAAPAGERTAAPDRVLPVLPAIASVLPDGGLRRGSTVVLTGSTSLLLATLCVPSRAGAWCAVVGRPTLGLAASAEYGIAMERLALVPEPGHRWQTVTAALLDALDVVAVRPTGRFGGRFGGLDARRLSGRARERGAVLISLGDWEGADVRLWVGDAGWSGLGQGHGRLRSRRMVVHARGRGAASQPRRTTLVLRAAGPGRFGAVDVEGAEGAVADVNELDDIAGVNVPIDISATGASAGPAGARSGVPGRSRMGGAA